MSTTSFLSTNRAVKSNSPVIITSNVMQKDVSMQSTFNGLSSTDSCSTENDGLFDMDMNLASTFDLGSHSRITQVAATIKNALNTSTDENNTNAPIPTRINLEDYDLYGFKIQNQHVTQEQWKKAQVHILKSEKQQTEKWQRLIKQNKGGLPEKDGKVKKLIRRGIPPQLRRNIWLHYSGASEKMEKNPNVYAEMLQKEQKRPDGHSYSEHIDVIDRDINRTFPENLFFQTNLQVTNMPSPPFGPVSNVPLTGSLRRVLVAFSFYNPEIGYCQSLNYICGMLLLVMSEEEAFWALDMITSKLLPTDMYSSTLIGTLVEMKVVDHIMQRKCEDLHAKVRASGVVDITMLTSPWFLTLYVNHLPNATLLRVWDVFFYEGIKMLYRVALTIFNLVKKDVLEIEDPVELFQAIQRAPKSMADPRKLLGCAFQRYGSKAVGGLSNYRIRFIRSKEKHLMKP